MHVLSNGGAFSLLILPRHHQQFALACTQAGRQLLWPKDTEHSDELFSGLAGAACFLLDATDAASSWFPGFELPS